MTSPERVKQEVCRFCIEKGQTAMTNQDRLERLEEEICAHCKDQGTSSCSQGCPTKIARDILQEDLKRTEIREIVGIRLNVRNNADRGRKARRDLKYAKRY